MEWINYHHLLYFWTVVQEGSIAKACKKLRLAQPTISTQIQSLEESLGQKLFKREGKRLVITETGNTVYQYADEIFGIGQELLDTLKGRPIGKSLRFRIGIADVLPKLITFKLLRPAFSMPEPIRIVCYDGRPKELLSRLAIHELDVVLSDQPMAPDVKIKAYNHFLGECGTTIFGTQKLVTKYKKKLPESLNDAPFLLPTMNTSLRRSIEEWFDEVNVRPNIIGEFEDSACLKVFGQEGRGFFFAATAIEPQIKKQYGALALTRVKSIKEKFYAISAEKRIKHPAVSAITKAAHQKIFCG